MLHVFFSRGLFFDLQELICHSTPKYQLTFDKLHCGISQKIELFITTTVITSNLIVLIVFNYAISELCPHSK
jgi:hypothetical protein